MWGTASLLYPNGVKVYLVLIHTIETKQPSINTLEIGANKSCFILIIKGKKEWC